MNSMWWPLASARASTLNLGSAAESDGAIAAATPATIQGKRISLFIKRPGRGELNVGFIARTQRVLLAQALNSGRFPEYQKVTNGKAATSQVLDRTPG